MNAKIYKFPENPAESEKITINLGFVDLGHIDLLVRDGFYSNRTDFIRTSIRNQLSTIELGLRQYTKSDLEALQTTGEKLRVKILGLVTISSDVSPSLALATIESITVLGALHASKEVKTALADRII